MLRSHLTASAVLALVALASTPTAAQKRSPKQAAKDFTIDTSTLTPEAQPSADAAVGEPARASDTPPTAASAPAEHDAAAGTAGAPSATAANAVPASDAADAPIVTTLAPAATLDTPIAQLIANPATKAVLDKDLPGLTSDANLGRFQGLSLRRFQPLTGGQLTPALLQKVAADLAAIKTAAPTVFTPATLPPRKRRAGDDSGR